MGDEWQMSVMIATLISDDTQLDELLIGANKEMLDFIFAGSTPLCRAAQTPKNIAKVKKLLQAGASVDFRCKSNRTPLMKAAESGCTDICHLLLQHGADVNATTAYSWNPLCYASYCGHRETTALLLQHREQISCVVNSFGRFALVSLAVIKGHIHMLKFFQGYFEKLNSRIPLGLLYNTALHFNQTECAIFILHQGYFPHQKTEKPRKGFTSSFEMATSEKWTEWMKILIELNPQCLQEEWFVQKQCPQLFYAHPTFRAWLLEHRKHAPSLMHLCKSKILAQLDTYYKPKIHQLHLPKALKAYLEML